MNRFLGIRHEIEHQMTMRIDSQLSAKFMAAALNFNSLIKKEFGPAYALEKEQAFSIQFSSINPEIAKELMVQADLPKSVRSFLVQFEKTISQEEYDDPRFSYRVAFVQKVTNSKSAADQLFQVVPPGTEVSEAMNKAFLKETEKMKYRPKTIVDQMQVEGFVKFNMHKHTLLWQEKDAKNPKHHYGTQVETQWYWYEPWLKQVREHCKKEESLYKPSATAPGATEQNKAG